MKQSLVIFGGGPLAYQVARKYSQNLSRVHVVTSPRHSNELINGVQFSTLLDQILVPYEIVTTLKVSERYGFEEINDAHYFSVGASWVFSKKFISDKCSDRLLNFHGRRLPQNRGGGGFSWQILMGIRHGYSVIHEIVPSLDAGRIVGSREFLYSPEIRTPKQYEDLSIEQDLLLLEDFLVQRSDQGSSFVELEQSEYFSTYWPRLSTLKNGFIDWNLDPIELDRFICAFDDPYEGASTFLNGELVHLKSVMLCSQDSNFHSFQVGIIFRKREDWICVALKGMSLIIKSITDASGSSVMSRIAVGDRLCTPVQHLRDSMTRIRYSSEGLRG